MLPPSSLHPPLYIYTIRFFLLHSPPSMDTLSSSLSPLRFSSSSHPPCTNIKDDRGSMRYRTLYGATDVAGKNCRNFHFVRNPAFFFPIPSRGLSFRIAAQEREGERTEPLVQSQNPQRFGTLSLALLRVVRRSFPPLSLSLSRIISFESTIMESRRHAGHVFAQSLRAEY